MTQIKLKIYKDKLLLLSANRHSMHVSDEELILDSDTMHACMLTLGRTYSKYQPINYEYFLFTIHNIVLTFTSSNANCLISKSVHLMRYAPIWVCI